MAFLKFFIASNELIVDNCGGFSLVFNMQRVRV